MTLVLEIGSLELPGLQVAEDDDDPVPGTSAPPALSGPMPRTRRCRRSREGMRPGLSLVELPQGQERLSQPCPAVKTLTVIEIPALPGKNWQYVWPDSSLVWSSPSDFASA